MRKDYTVGLAITETALDDPDQMFYENYVCGAERNYTGYCNPEFDKLVDAAIGRAGYREAPRAGLAARAQAGRGRRPAGHLLHARRTCWQPRVKGFTLMVNSLFNGWRMEDVWLDK